ncbi:hypothetical protein JTE90_005317 [Oedothorax gibbosus]|uniref:Uncharacterized protein n=1 Tax=Oedothorax gibbosus TaxID=931172 RepID=A0AAV6UJH6_9ARAC|nr:hypothetical protein JTE90_005317 [Oedothorax gibbosus]
MRHATYPDLTEPPSADRRPSAPCCYASAPRFPSHRSRAYGSHRRPPPVYHPVFAHAEKQLLLLYDELYAMTFFDL